MIRTAPVTVTAQTMLFMITVISDFAVDVQAVIRNQLAVFYVSDRQFAISVPV